MYSILIISIILFIIPVIITIAVRYEKKKTAEYQDFAARHKLSFEPKGDRLLTDELSVFKLYAKGRRRKIQNVMQVNTEEAELSVMEFSYNTHNGKNTHKWIQTVVYFKSHLLNLPGFEMTPENIFHKIGKVFGYQDIDFSSYPDFSKHFLLRGKDEESIRKLFNTRVLHHFNSEKGISIEGNDNKLIYYKNAKRIKIDQLKKFMDEAIQVFNLFAINK